MTKKKILCVEDHPDTCELISMILRDYEVISANAVAEALRNASADQFELYLLDYHLPDGTGEELAASIRNFDTATPILFITATSSITEREVRSLGAQGLIRKSSLTFIEDLLRNVNRFLMSEPALRSNF